MVVCLFVDVHCQSRVPWAFNAYIDDEYVLYCNDSETQIATNEIVRWKTPSGQNLADDQNDQYQVLEMHGITGYALKIKKMTSSDGGIYVCHIYSGNDVRHTLVRGLNLSGPMYHSLSDKYRDQFIVAIVATVVFFVPFVGVCGIYKFRYKMYDDDKRDYLDNGTGMRETVADNVRYNEKGAYANPGSTNL